MWRLKVESQTLPLGDKVVVQVANAHDRINGTVDRYLLGPIGWVIVDGREFPLLLLLRLKDREPLVETKTTLDRTGSPVQRWAMLGLVLALDLARNFLEAKSVVLVVKVVARYQGALGRGVLELDRLRHVPELIFCSEDPVVVGVDRAVLLSVVGDLPLLRERRDWPVMAVQVPAGSQIQQADHFAVLDRNVLDELPPLP
mmetsp:Transcript_26790/g.87742  ORF Transcript_26790/g.87742 Transcript_26790/m.87742 type:complete len:200 (+) Transcript_26790:188-787(+)